MNTPATIRAHAANPDPIHYDANGVPLPRHDGRFKSLGEIVRLAQHARRARITHPRKRR